ncbi:caspase a-like [Neosynchiropus ocellatus]
MADELGRVRKTFISSSNRALLSQLLDDLLDDGVLNDGEKEAIEEGYSIIQDRARQLISIVIKKGDDASWKMIAHLKERDNNLFTVLGLKARPCTPAAASLNQNVNMAPWQDGDANCLYPVTEATRKNRVALLITNIEFSNPSNNRKGAKADQKNMEHMLRWLHYDVVSLTNLTGQQIEDAVVEFSKHPKLKSTDSVVVIIMSHGKLGKVLGVGPQPDEFLLSKVYEQLSTDKCPALLDKPKIIIIQACRVDGPKHKRKITYISTYSGAHLTLSSIFTEQSGTVYVEDGTDEYIEDALRSAHREKDFISLLSCTPDTASYRHPEEGSVLIQYLADVFAEHAKEDHIEELFRKVMQRFEVSFAKDKYQMPTKDRCSLARHFFFFPR